MSAMNFPYQLHSIWQQPPPQISPIPGEMASHAEMEDFIEYLRFIAAGVLILSGLVIQLFIVAMNVSDQLRGRLMSATDQIIISLGLSRLIFHFASLLLFVQNVFYFTAPAIIYWVIFLIGSPAYSGNVWLSVLLSMVFFLKISNMHHVLFLRLKTMMTQRVVIFIALCVLWSALDGFKQLAIPYRDYLASNNFTTSEDRRAP